jgi:hypothetical protein
MIECQLIVCSLCVGRKHLFDSTSVENWMRLTSEINDVRRASQSEIFFSRVNEVVIRFVFVHLEVNSERGCQGQFSLHDYELQPTKNLMTFRNRIVKDLI